MQPRILFVDDESAILRALSRQLSINYDMTTAYSGDEALELLGGRGVFNVVVTDVQMPGLNGLDMVDQAAERHPHCRFIVLTGNADQPTLLRAELHPAITRVLLKPSRIETLRSAIEHASAASIGAKPEPA